MSDSNTVIEKIKEQLTELFDEMDDDADFELFYDELGGLKDHISEMMDDVDSRIYEINDPEASDTDTE
jgi:ATP-dependent 26S proteasome regulatory subunit